MSQRVNRRLRALTAQLAAAAVEELPEAGSGPGGQGFGPRATESPPHFACDELEAAIAFFEEMGYVCFKEALTEAQLAHINDFCDRTQRDDPVGWQIPTDGSPWTGARYSQPLLDTEELDYCVKLDSIFPFVTAIFGEGNERFSEFNLRDTPGGAGSLKMGFHHDAALGHRTTRKPYHPCDWLCSICCKSSTRSMSPFCQRSLNAAAIGRPHGRLSRRARIRRRPEDCPPRADRPRESRARRRLHRAAAVGPRRHMHLLCVLEHCPPLSDGGTPSADRIAAFAQMTSQLTTLGSIL